MDWRHQGPGTGTAQAAPWPLQRWHSGPSPLLCRLCSWGVGGGSGRGLPRRGRPFLPGSRPSSRRAGDPGWALGFVAQGEAGADPGWGVNGEKWRSGVAPRPPLLRGSPTSGPARPAASHVTTSQPPPRLQEACVCFRQWPLRRQRRLNEPPLSFTQPWEGRGGGIPPLCQAPAP